METSNMNLSDAEQKREFGKCWNMSNELAGQLSEKFKSTGFNHKQVIVTLGMTNGIILGSIFAQMEEAWVEQELPVFLQSLEDDIRSRIKEIRATLKNPIEG